MVSGLVLPEEDLFLAVPAGDCFVCTVKHAYTVGAAEDVVLKQPRVCFVLWRTDGNIMSHTQYI